MKRIGLVLIMIVSVFTLSSCVGNKESYYTQEEVDAMITKLNDDNSLEERILELESEMVIESEGYLYNDCSTSDDVRVCHRIYLTNEIESRLEYTVRHDYNDTQFIELTYEVYKGEAIRTEWSECIETCDTNNNIWTFENEEGILNWFNIQIEIYQEYID